MLSSLLSLPEACEGWGIEGAQDSKCNWSAKLHVSLGQSLSWEINLRVLQMKLVRKLIALTVAGARF